MCFSLRKVAVFLLSMVLAYGKPNYACLTLAKSGTHLLHKCLQKLAEKDPNFEGPDYPISFAHPSQMMNDHRRLPEAEKLVVMLRDPRDVCLSLARSYAYYYNVHSDAPEVQLEVKRFRCLMSDVTLGGVLLPDHMESWTGLGLQDKMVVLIHSLYPRPFNTLNHDIQGMWVAMNLRKQTNAPLYICRFERLVGSRGGGSDAEQFQEIRGLCGYLGAHLTDDDVRDVGAQLFGNTATFKQGQIGAWREHFSQRVRQAFYIQYQQVLEDWDYEPDGSWTFQCLLPGEKEFL